MASQEEEVQSGTETTAEDTAKFSGAWDEFEDKDQGQPDPASGRSDAGTTDDDQGGNEAGQGEAEAGQPDASASPSADAGSPASRGEISDDVLANADPAVKAYIEQLQAGKAKAENLARSNGGRLAQSLNELNALKAKLAPEKSGDASGEATNRSERLEQLREEYPEVAAPILDHMAKLEERVEALATTETARAESAVADALSQEHATLLERHPDLPSIVADPAYAEWVKAQTPAIQRIVQENSQAVVNAGDAALVFDLFKASRGQQGESEAAKAARERGQKRADQLDAGRTATGASQPGVQSTASGEAKDYGDAWDEFDRKDRQKAAGRR